MFFNWSCIKRKKMNENKNPKIANTRSFKEIKGFSFEYPEFEEWTVHHVEQNARLTNVLRFEINVFFNHPTELQVETPAHMGVTRDYSILNYPNFNNMQLKQNPKGIRFEQNPVLNKAIFYLEKTAVTVDISSIPNKQGFSSNRFIEEIIRSFQTNR